jgi:uncharacterized protein
MSGIHKLVVMGRTINFDPADVRPLPPREDQFPSISSLALDVAGTCNMRCAYCAESMTLPKRMPMDPGILNLAIEKLFEWSKPGSGVSIHFGSGEPLLQADAVKDAGNLAKKMAREQKRPLSLHLTTNGTPLTPQIIKWLAKSGWEVKVSVDGPKEVHDRFRRTANGEGTYSRIERSVRTLSSIIPDRFSTTSVLCKNINPAQVFYGIARLGVRRIEMVPVAAKENSPFLLGPKDWGAYRRFIRDYAEKTVRSRSLPMNIRFRKRLQRVVGLGNSQIACGAGRNFFAAGPEGALYPCFRFVGIEAYRLGDLSSGIKKSAVGRFALGPGRPYSKRKGCRQCWAAPLCDGPCFAGVELIGKGSSPAGFCEMTRADCEAALWLADVLRRKNPKKLALLVGIDLSL